MDYNKIIIVLAVILITLIICGVLFLDLGHAKVDSSVVVLSNSTLHEGDSFTILLTDLNNTSISNQVVNVSNKLRNIVYLLLLK